MDVYSDDELKIKRAFFSRMNMQKIFFDIVFLLQNEYRTGYSAYYMEFDKYTLGNSLLKVRFCWARTQLPLIIIMK